MATQTETLQETSREMFGPLTFEYNHKLTNTETKCLLCSNTFDLSSSVRLFLKHIFEAHNVVIDDIQMIEKLPEYILYWRNRFSINSIEEIIPSLSVDCTGHKYFLLSPLLKEDKELRHRLKLEYVLDLQELERNDKSFVKECLFCRLEFKGTRHGYLDHLSSTHNILLGNPLNLVYIDEMIDKLLNKIKQLKCIYCEKTFPSHSILKEHMRKKLHKRINPNTTEYDKYFIVNYLEIDKTWRDIEKEDDKYPFPPGAEPNGDEEYGDWNEQEEFTTCLFCPVKEKFANVIQSHMLVEHGFSFSEETDNLDFYHKIKLVNYIRKQIHDNKCPFCDVHFEDFERLQKHFVEETHYKVPELKVFDKPEYFFPTYENDSFLYFVEDFTNGFNRTDNEI